MERHHPDGMPQRDSLIFQLEIIFFFFLLFSSRYFTLQQDLNEPVLLINTVHDKIQLDGPMELYIRTNYLLLIGE